MLNFVMKYILVICGVVGLLTDKSSLLIPLLYFAIAGLFSIATSIDTLSYKETEKTRAMLEGIKYGQLRNNKQPEEA